MPDVKEIPGQAPELTQRFIGVPELFMCDQVSELIPYTMISVPAFVFFKTDYHLVRFVGSVSSNNSNSLEPFVPLIVDLTLCRAVDNYLAYVSDLLTLVYELAMGRRKPKRLSHLGIVEQDKYVRDDLDFVILDGCNHPERIQRIVEIRNLFTHNRGIISAGFLERVSGFGAQVGELIQIQVQEVAEDLVFLQNSVRDIGFRAGRRFNIPRLCPLFSNP